MKKILTISLVLILILAFTGVASAASIDSYSSGISKSGSRVTMSAYTHTIGYASTIRNTMALQKKVGSSWVTITSVARTGSGYSLSSSASMTVSSGRYRTRTTHYATGASPKTSTSGEIQVG